MKKDTKGNLQVKRKRGRPAGSKDVKKRKKKSNKKNRTEIVLLRVTEETKEFLRIKAKEKEETINDYMGRLIINEIRKNNKLQGKNKEEKQ